jgi:hypothetical protein
MSHNFFIIDYNWIEARLEWAGLPWAEPPIVDKRAQTKKDYFLLLLLCRQKKVAFMNSFVLKY